MRRWWLWAALGTGLLLITTQQGWATGTWQDPVLGTTRVEATGAEVSGTLAAGALLAGAALLAGLVGSRLVRLVAAACLAGGAVLAGTPAVSTLLSPGQAVEGVARDRPGSATANVVVEDAAATLWPWLGAVAAGLVLLGALLCALHWLRGRGSGSGGGPALRGTQDSDTQDPGTSDRGAAGSDTTDPGAVDSGTTGRNRPGRERPHDPWDDLTRGHDPTTDT